MPQTSTRIGDSTILLCPPEGSPLKTEQDALDLIGDAFGSQADTVVIPTERLDDAFFDLSTRNAGGFLQKFVNYGLRVAIVGDISTHLEESNALRAFVAESNRGRDVWFVSTLDDLTARLTPAD
ncbi:hypothetical protein Arub01_35550 [Actinomadura rubrobrunea]|uniref:DUF4180 domain-containing protein n=1 Tax=Actinomadura rubrobrunea TaxID=115335 RepID=A0A9W6UV48_9ACTN|nr:DUF4180 domain-containing protein [Actinomadura rubrobrunea]GLW65311.1 hypothetical protein Arub01_35550 [Actinomadura rubrobrunea]